MSVLRKERGRTQNIFLIETIINENNKERNYMIMGSTGNVYKVTIKEIPECTCPDFQTRNRRCKHIYFVLIRIMKTTNEDKDIYTNLELELMFTNIPTITNNLIIGDNSKKKYEQLKNELGNNTTEIEKKGLDDVCPVCLDDLTDGNELDFCKYSCGRSIHKLCFSMWCKKNTAKCVYCNSDWNKKNDIKYINLCS